MKYFQIEMTAEEAQNVFHQLSQRLHPDKPGGNDKAFADLRQEYDDFKAIKRNFDDLKVHFEQTLPPPVVEYVQVPILEYVQILPDNLNELIQSEVNRIIDNEARVGNIAEIAKTSVEGVKELNLFAKTVSKAINAYKKKK